VEKARAMSIMNSIIVTKSSDLKKIIASPILLTGQGYLEKEEIYENMWSINVTEQLLPAITKDALITFVNRLLHNRQEQVTALKQPATFYMWNDSMIGDLRFNLLSGHRDHLPFGSIVDPQDSIEPLLEEFISDNNNRVLLWNELEFLNPDSEDKYDEEDIIYTTKVYSLFLNP
jgi:hypothetical protein